jgi:hypothetical protein
VVSHILRPVVTSIIANTVDAVAHLVVMIPSCTHQMPTEIVQVQNQSLRLAARRHFLVMQTESIKSLRSVIPNFHAYRRISHPIQPLPLATAIVSAAMCQRVLELHPQALPPPAPSPNPTCPSRPAPPHPSQAPLSTDKPAIPSLPHRLVPAAAAAVVTAPSTTGVTTQALQPRRAEPPNMVHLLAVASVGLL